MKSKSAVAKVISSKKYILVEGAYTTKHYHISSLASVVARTIFSLKELKKDRTTILENL